MKRNRDKNAIRKCNFCGTLENLSIDKLTGVRRICKSCLSIKAKEGTQIQKVLKQENKPIVKFPYIKYSATNSILNIEFKFFEHNYIGKRLLVEDLSKLLNISVRRVRKYLQKYNISEIHFCRHCKSPDNLLIMESRVCNCCSSCWKKTYVNRPHRKAKEKKPLRFGLNTTSGIGIKAQFFFKELHDFLDSNKITYDEIVYGYYDLKARKRVKSEKSVKITNKSKRSLDFYLRIGTREISIEFDELGHFDLVNRIKDFHRESEIFQVKPSLEMYRVSEFYAKNYKQIIFEDILSTIKDKRFYSHRLLNVTDERILDLQEESSYNTIYQNYYEIEEFRKGKIHLM
jgi:hypothetical protein